MFLGNQSFILSQIVYIFVFMGGNLLGSRAKKMDQSRQMPSHCRSYTLKGSLMGNKTSR